MISPGFSLLTRQKACEGFPGMQTLFFTPFLSFHVSFSLSLTLQTPQRTRRRKLNALFQRDNLHLGEEKEFLRSRLIQLPPGGTQILFLLHPSLPLSLSHLLDGLR